MELTANKEIEDIELIENIDEENKKVFAELTSSEMIKSALFGVFGQNRQEA